ncbi:MAG: cobalt-precorrin 5A hydrolase [Desulfobacteraceae bacterium]
MDWEEKQQRGDPLGENETPEFQKLAVWAITPNGITHGILLARQLGSADLFVSRRLDLPPFSDEKITVFPSLSKEITARFNQYQGHIFIFSAGIAVRLIARLMDSKLNDPAVVVLDDRACHAVSLISGHIGGGNDLARKTAAITGAVPVITTATDVNTLPAVDLIAKQQNLVIENTQQIKPINMAILKNQIIRIYDPCGLVLPALPPHLAIPLADGGDGPVDLVCSDRVMDVPRETLVLRPRFLAAGIGCNRGTTTEEIQTFLDQVFQENDLSLDGIFTIATSHVKADEGGLLRCAEKMGLEVVFFTKEQLNSVTTIETPSKMAEKHLGVKSVCEAAAILATRRGTLVVPKQKRGNVTVAVARKGPGFL